MNTFIDVGPGQWLLKATWQASVLIGLVLAAQWLFRKQLTPRWRYSLWLLVVARLALPFAPESGLSVFNCFRSFHTPAALPTVATVQKTVNTPAPAPAGTPAIYQQEIDRYFTTPDPTPPPASAVTEIAPTTPRAAAQRATPPPQHRAFPWMILLFNVWLAGGIALIVHVFLANQRLSRRMRGRRPVTESSVLGLLEDCKQSMGVWSPVQVLETRDVSSPALYGFIRPRLLLPEGLIARFTRQELRHVFLHELAHVKRHDIAMNWLMTALQIVHWFNPLVWVAFHRMRADRELACDALALSYSRDEETNLYGRTIIKLLEGFSRPAALPGLVGILEDKKQMERRIRMIKLFDRKRRWPVLASVLLAVLAIVSLTDAQTPAPKPVIQPAQVPTVAIPDEKLPHPDLHGQVNGPDGAALANATVFIFSAGPKLGTSPFCPTCYADCRKSTKTDASGNFKIESLDPQLIFRILVVAKDHKPLFVPGIDPSRTNPIVKLAALNIADTPPERRVTGRVLDKEGKPIHGAVVESFGIHTKDGGGRFGQLATVDPVSVTDENGEFLITSREDFENMDVNVEARALAKKSFTRLLASGKPNDLTLTEGASFTGRVMLDGKPLANVAVGVAGADRTAGNFTGNYDVGTDASGRFLLANLPPKAQWYIYGLVDTFKSKGAIPTGSVTSGADGEITDVGDLMVRPAHRLSGRVVLEGGGEIPPKTRLLASREKAWDTAFYELPPDGRFEIEGLPTETYGISVRVKGYRVSAKNGSLDALNPYHLIGRVDRDITNLVYLLEPGPDLASHFDQYMSDSDRPNNRILRGAEGANDHTGQRMVSGRVLDAETGEPLSRFKVTPGSARGGIQGTSWDALHAMDVNSGNYTLYFETRIVSPVIKVEVEGYLPVSLPVSIDQTNLDFKMKKGAGPRGRVLSADGKPVSGATVVLICADDRQVGFSYEGKLGTWQHGERQASTDADGQFRFRPELDMQAVAMAGPDGFKVVSVADLAADAKVTLEPWGTVTGTLKRPDGAGKAEDLDLAFSSALPNDAHLRLSCHAVTDDSGKFKFERVPAGKLQVTYRLPMGNNGWQSLPLQSFELTPGQNLQLNINGPARATNSMPQPAVAQPIPRRVPGQEYKGAVLLPNGKPATSAQVGLQTSNSVINLKGAQLEGYMAWQQGLIINVGPDGGFSLPKEDGAVYIMAVDARGFARVTMEEFKSSPKLTLRPWGRLEGTLHIGNRLGTNELVRLLDSEWPRPLYQFDSMQARTDNQGKFAIEMVPPGAQSISRLIPYGNSQMSGTSMPVTIKSGDVTQASFGGNGQSVIGQIVIKDQGIPPKWRVGYGSIHTSFSPQPGAGKTEEDWKAWRKKFRFFPIIVDAGGAFRADDVAPGAYILTIQFVKAESADMGPGWREAAPAGLIEQEITIPNSANPSELPPIDLGMLEPKFNAAGVSAKK
jgi:beta-lactamase regulating signal transducer with metallopeptidase domain/uncharacterized GH25 family protein